MIELRWKETLEIIDPERQIGRTVKILQFRTMENIQELGFYEPIWSEWEQVPTEYIEG